MVTEDAVHRHARDAGHRPDGAAGDQHDGDTGGPQPPQGATRGGGNAGGLGAIPERGKGAVEVEQEDRALRVDEAGERRPGGGAAPQGGRAGHRRGRRRPTSEKISSIQSWMV